MNLRRLLGMSWIEDRLYTGDDPQVPEINAMVGRLVELKDEGLIGEVVGNSHLTIKIKFFGFWKRYWG